MPLSNGPGVNVVGVPTTGQTVQWNGTAWVPATSLTSYGTSLPGSPIDGQEAILVDSTTNPSYQWRFRYNAGSSSSFKWEFIGGVELSSEGAGGAMTAVNGWQIWTTSPPADLTYPRSGDYYTTISASVGISSSTWGATQVGAGPSTAIVLVSTSSNYSEAGTFAGSIRFQQTKTAHNINITAGQLAKPLLFAGGGTPGSLTALLWRTSILPIRVS